MCDPGCAVGYSASPAIAVLRWRFGDQLTWRLITIGLADTAAQYDARGFTPMVTIAGRLGFRRFGMPFTTAPRTRNMSTSLACRALIAARLRDPASELAVFRALQFGFMTTTLMMDSVDGVRIALEAVPGLEVDAIVHELESDEVHAAYQGDRATARQAAGTPSDAMGRTAQTDGPIRYTAPTLIFDSGRSRLEAGGLQTLEAYDVCLANLAPDLERESPASTALDALEAFPEGLTTIEVATLMTPRLQQVDRVAAESQLIQATIDGKVTRMPLADDALWRAN
jgi:protein-disulfide isomerase-like protein with CxxC motif